MDMQAIIDNFRRNVTEHYFDMQGRVRRSEFWHFILATVIVEIIAAIIGGLLHIHLLQPVVGLALLLPVAGMGARRLQDTGRNGALVWILIIPSLIMAALSILVLASGIIGFLGFVFFFAGILWLIDLIVLVAAIVLIYFWCQPGTPGANAYGAATAAA
jgi:uncharacterized membrane protein YhaH (DUF805 family)